MVFPLFLWNNIHKIVNIIHFPFTEKRRFFFVKNKLEKKRYLENKKIVILSEKNNIHIINGVFIEFLDI